MLSVWLQLIKIQRKKQNKTKHNSFSFIVTFCKEKQNKTKPEIHKQKPPSMVVFYLSKKADEMEEAMYQVYLGRSVPSKETCASIPICSPSVAPSFSKESHSLPF